MRPTDFESRSAGHLTSLKIDLISVIDPGVTTREQCRELGVSAMTVFAANLYGIADFTVEFTVAV
jgi:hypothetical protein